MEFPYCRCKNVQIMDIEIYFQDFSVLWTSENILEGDDLVEFFWSYPLLNLLPCGK